MTGSDAEQGAKPSDANVPTCYRHAGRETYIRCSRCNRYICPECMTAAPVGFQCPECLETGKKSVREARTPLGGQIRQHGDVITKSLIGINVVVWLFSMVYSTSSALYSGISQGSNLSELSARFALIEGSTQPTFSIGVAAGEWYRLLTAAFMHEEWWHLGINMLALWILGSVLEPVLGRWRFIALYLLSALGGSAVSLLAPDSFLWSLGASGAVFGLLGALFVVMRSFGRDVSTVVAILVLNVVIGFTVPSIDWRAHLGGLVVGGLLALAFAHAPRRYRTQWSIAGCVVVAIGVIVMVMLTVS